MLFEHFLKLTLSLAIPLRLYTLPYWSIPPLLIFDILALWLSGLSTRPPICQKLKVVVRPVVRPLDPSNSSSFEQLVLEGLILTVGEIVVVVVTICGSVNRLSIISNLRWSHWIDSTWRESWKRGKIQNLINVIGAVPSFWLLVELNTLSSGWRCSPKPAWSIDFLWHHKSVTNGQTLHYITIVTWCMLKCKIKSYSIYYRVNRA